MPTPKRTTKLIANQKIIDQTEARTQDLVRTTEVMLRTRDNQLL